MIRIILIIIFLLSGCGFEPIYVNTNIKNLEFQKISYIGDNYINRKITNNLKLIEKESDPTLDKIEILSNYKITETSKDSKGNIETYLSSVSVELNITSKDNQIIKRIFNKDISYSNRENKFALVSYQKEIQITLLNEIIKEILLFLNTQ